MIKKLLPTAVLLATVGAAQAQVTLYGLIDLSYGKNDIYVNSPRERATFHSGADNDNFQGNAVTRVGVKGSRDVGTGVKANFKLESNGITSEGTVNRPTFARAAWAGLSGSFGEVRLGRQDNVPFQTMLDFDFNGAANAASAQQNSLATPWSLNDRQSRSLQYIAPDMGGFAVQAGFVPKTDTAGSKATYSAGVKYTAGKMVVAAAGQSKSTVTGANFASVAGSYDFGVVKAMVSYTDGGAGFKGTSVGVVAPVAGFNVGMTYAKNSDAAGAVATEFYVNREIYKNTYAYFDYGNLNKANAYFAKGNAYALGVIFTF